MKTKKTNKIIKFILLLGIIFFLSIALYLSKNLFIENYIQIAPAVIIGIFFILGLLSFITLIKFNYFISKENKIYKSTRTNRWKFIWTIIVVIIISKILILSINKLVNPTTIDKNNIIEIKGTIKELPIYESGPKSGSGYIDFKINEYPKIRFCLPYPDYFHYKTSIENDFNLNDSVFFSISKEDFHAYIKKDKDYSFSQKHLNHNTICVITIRSNDCDYLTVELHNQLNKEDSKYMTIVIIFTFLFGLLIIQSIWKNEIFEYLNTKRAYKIKRFLEMINNK